MARFPRHIQSIKIKEIEDKLGRWQQEIEAGKFAVFMIDEYRLRWSYLLVYSWGITDQRIKVPSKSNTKPDLISRNSRNSKSLSDEGLDIYLTTI